MSNWTCKELEASLLPTSGNIIQKAAIYAFQFFKCLVMLPPALVTSLISSVVTRICGGKTPDSPLVAFAKHPQWGPPVDAAPVNIGFASADFQENGPGVHPLTNFGKHYIDTQKDGNFDRMPDIWNHPERLITRLNELGIKHYRCSISRDKLQPQKDGPIDEVAKQHYRQLFALMRANGIHLTVTLDHFSTPLYFSWDRPEDVAGFVKFAEDIADFLHAEGVRNIVTINEPTVVAFQGWVMGEFPPYHKLDFEASARVIENMMRAHTQIYEKMKARHGDFQIGLSHDPIRFRNFHKSNPLWTPLEKLICHYLSEVNGGAFMRFLQTGKFDLKVPFRTNYTFEALKPPPLDFIGLQYYTDPLLKLSFTGGASVTRIPNEKLSSYEYRQYPQGLASALDEFNTLTTPTGGRMKIKITEVGIDRGINTDETDKERIAHFDKIFQVVQKAIENGVDIDELDFWTLIDNAEWYKKWAVRFGFYEFNQKNGDITQLPAARWVKERVAARNAALAPRAVM